MATTTQGKLDLAWLDHCADPLRAPLFPEAHADHHAHEQLVALSPPLAPGRPVRKENDGDDFHACGWIFSPEDVFDADRLLELMCGGYAARRVKGVFRVAADEWVLVNRSGEPYRRSEAELRSLCRLSYRSLVSYLSARPLSRKASGSSQTRCRTAMSSRSHPERCL